MTAITVLYETDKYHLYKQYTRSEQACPHCGQFEVWDEFPANNEGVCTACRHHILPLMTIHGDSKTDKRVIRQLCQGFTYGPSTPRLTAIQEESK